MAAPHSGAQRAGVEGCRRTQTASTGKAALSYGSGPNGERFDVVDKAVDRLETIERALGAAEQMIMRALTHVRFGLGPYSPRKLSWASVKPGTGLGERQTGHRHR